MTIEEAVTNYISFRRSEGSQAVGTEAVLRTLCRQLGTLDIAQVSASQISAFTHDPKLASVTRITRFSIVRCFFEYYSVRRHIPFLTLERPPRTIVPRYPLIFTRSQIRCLLQATRKCPVRSEGLDAETFGMILLVLYATGMTIREVLTLRHEGVDLRSRKIRLEGTFSRPARDLPIGPDLCKALKAYKHSHKARNRHANLFFHKVEGQPVRHQRLTDRFEYLCSLAGIGLSPQGHKPRVTDLRPTFAVHRIRTWVQQGANLNCLLPALSTYMGYASLTKAEQFLTYVPERFKDDLRKLSPTIRSRQWNSEPELIAFLSSL